jgi:AbiV family abortive infection protein
MKDDSKLDPYRGTLNPFQIAEGIRCVKINGSRLFKDAEFLYEQKRFPSASSLAILAIEEFGKVPILRRMALATSPEEWKVCWKDFSNHLTKSLNWMVPFLIKNKEKTIEDKYQLFKDTKEPELLNSIKQLGFYVGCYANAHWASPDKIIEQENADVAMKSALIVSMASQPSPYDTPSALQEWAKQMAGCYSVDPITANNKVVEFLKAHSKDHEYKIPPEVSFEFVSTVLYLSENVAAATAT